MPRDFLHRIVAGSIHRPRLVVASWLVVLLVALVGLRGIAIDTATSTFLDKTDAAWRFYQSSIERFGGDEFVAIAFRMKEPYQLSALIRGEEIARRLEALPGVRRVDSLFTTPSIYAGPNSSLIFDPIVSKTPRVPGDALEIARRVRADRIAPRNFVSPDEKVIAMNVVLEHGNDAGLASLLSRIDESVSDAGAWVSGVPVFRTRVNSRTAVELERFVPITLAVVIVVIVVAFRELWAVAITLSVATVGTVVVLGVMGFVGSPISLSTVTLPPILLALGCAYVMHVLWAAQRASSRGTLEEAITEVARPVALSGLTTAIGFLAMATIPVAAIWELGSFGALGAFSVATAAVTLAPAMLRLRGLHADSAVRVDRVVDARFRPFLFKLVQRRRGLIIGAWLCAAIASLVGMTKITVDTDIIRWFPIGSDVRDDYESIKESLAGITPLNVVIESNEGAAITEPQIVERIRDFTEFAEQLPEVGRALSVADYIQQAHERFSNEVGLPGTLAANEQYLAVLGSVEQIRDVISGDHLAANVLVRANVNGSSRIEELAKKLEAWWSNVGRVDVRARVTGVMYEFGRAEEAIAYGQIRGLLAALLAIGCVLLLVLRSFTLVFAALVPNLAPLCLAYGALGALGIPLDAAMVCMGSVAVGIAVDDTIHLAVRYTEGRRQGLGPEESLDAAFAKVLGALCLTTVAVAAGFLALSISEFALVRNFGVVTGGVVAICLLADATLLPAMLLALHRRA